MKTALLNDILIDARPGFASGKSDEHGIVQVRMNNVNLEGNLNFGTVRRVPEADTDLGRFALRIGDIVFNATNSPELVGKSALFRGHHEPVVYSNHFLRLRVKPAEAHSGYVSRWLQSKRTEGLFTSMCKQWVNQASVSPERLLALALPLPPLEEQRRIAAILDEADALRAKRRAALAQLDQMALAIFVEMFGDPVTNSKRWPRKPLKELVKPGDGVNYGVVQPGDHVDGGVPLVRVGDLIAGRVQHRKLKSISPEIEIGYRRSRLKGNEILVSCVGTIGLVALVTPQEKGFNIARAVARIPETFGVDRIFLAEYLRTDFVRNYFTSELRTVSQPTLNIKQIDETMVIVPPIDLQMIFGKRIGEYRELQRNSEDSADTLDSLFASLQHRAFRGEL